MRYFDLVEGQKFIEYPANVMSPVNYIILIHITLYRTHAVVELLLA